MVFYFLIWFCALNITQWFYFWFGLELLNWLLLLFLLRPLIFLLWQSLSSLFLIFSWVVVENNFFLFFRLLLKRGIIPFRVFILKLSWKWVRWLLFLTTHKLLPFLLLVLVNSRFFVYLFWILGGVYFLFQNSRLFNMIWIRRLSESAWLCLPFNLTKLFTFFLFYSLSWWAWAKAKNKRSLKINNVNRRVIFILTLALPPSLIFLIKIFIWTNLTASLGYVLALLSWLIIFIYFKWLILNLNLTQKFYERLNLWEWNFWLLRGHIIFFLLW